MFCQCGCGNMTPLYTQSNKNRGMKRGEHAKYIPGHNISPPTDKVMCECEYCGNVKEKYPSDAKRFRFCSRKCQGHFTRELTTKEAGSTFIDHYGYVWIKQPKHPMAIKLDHHGWVKEHRLIMSDKLGRVLEVWEHVHHKNEIKTDNDPNNLELTTMSEHARLHLNFRR